MTPLHFLECRAFKNSHGIGEVDQMLGEIGLPLGLVPLEKHPLAFEKRSIQLRMHEMYIHHTPSSVTLLNP
jgi:hypothetical protein